MNFTKGEVLLAEATMNQMRNSIYHLARFMEKNGKTDITERLRRMGRNMAKTFINYWKPTDLITTENIKDVITTIYQKIVNSIISIEINQTDNTIIVKDQKCALCKYHYEDINIAGCEILLGLVSEIISLVNEQSKNPSTIKLEPYKVDESRAYGNPSCIQIYKFTTGGN